jgi:hypothetical protein
MRMWGLLVVTALSRLGRCGSPDVGETKPAACDPGIWPMQSTITYLSSSFSELESVSSLCAPVPGVSRESFRGIMTSTSLLGPRLSSLTTAHQQPCHRNHNLGCTISNVLKKGENLGKTVPVSHYMQHHED